LQWAGLRVSSRFQEWTTALKFVAFLALVVAAFVVSAPAAASLPGAAPTDLTMGGLVAALQAVVITYGGGKTALYFTEEDRDPGRNLPRAMIGGVAAVIAVYLLVNGALMAVLPIPAMATSTLPAADAAGALAGDSGRRVITLLSIV